jgi:DNA-binding CsgD family transcriptional regulator
MDYRADTLNASAYQYGLAVQEQFQAICEPLFKLGIKFFSYGKAFQDGRYLFLLNDLNYSKAYLALIKDCGEIFTRQMHYTQKDQTHYYILSAAIDQFDKRHDPIMHLMYDFNIWNAFLIYKGVQEGFIEAYQFAGERQDVSFSSICLKNIVLLEHFCEYFNEKAQQLIDCTDQRKLAYYAQQFEFYQASKEDHFTQKIEQFLQETQLQRRLLKTHIGDMPLTKREEQCLYYLSLGKTVKEIARILDLSPRAVEFYVSKLKKKAGLSRNELLVAFARDKRINKDLSLFNPYVSS